VQDLVREKLQIGRVGFNKKGYDYSFTL